MKLKLVRHRLRSVIGFENSQFKFHHAEFNVLLTACSKRRQSRGLSSMTKCERLPFHCLCCQTQSAHLEGKERNLLSPSTSRLPVHFQDRERRLWGKGGRTVLEQVAH